MPDGVLQVMGVTAWWHDWAEDDVDRLAGALVSGHLIECGPYVVSSVGQVAIQILLIPIDSRREATLAASSSFNQITSTCPIRLQRSRQMGQV